MVLLLSFFVLLAGVGYRGRVVLLGEPILAFLALLEQTRELRLQVHLLRVFSSAPRRSRLLRRLLAARVGTPLLRGSFAPGVQRRVLLLLVQLSQSSLLLLLRGCIWRGLTAYDLLVVVGPGGCMGP